MEWNDMPANVEAKLKEEFQDVLTGEGFLKSPSTGRLYVRVATKGDARLYMNVDLALVCHHPPKKPGEKQDHVAATGVALRFFQSGGDESSFSPPLHVRASGGGLLRLSKHVFQVCASGHPDFASAWKVQGVSEQLLDWVKGVATFCGASPAPDALVRKVIDLPLAAFKAGDGLFFSLDVMITDGQGEGDHDYGGLGQGDDEQGGDESN
jgi:hypothetical protein